MGTDYKAIGSASDVENINPNTQNAWNAFAQMMPAAQAGMGDVIAGLQGLDYDPDAWYQQWQSQMPYMQQLSQMATDPYGAAGTSYADVMANRARGQVEQAYGGGGLYSGAFGKAVGEGMAAPYLQAGTQREALQANILQQLAGQGMGLSSANQQFATNTDLQSLAQQGNMWGNQLQTAGAGMAQLGAPEYWQPTYVEDQDPWLNALGGGLSGAATGFMTGGPMGALFGAGVGGLGGALGQSGAGLGYAAGSPFGEEGRYSGANDWLGDLFNRGGNNTNWGANMSSYNMNPNNPYDNPFVNEYQTYPQDIMIYRNWQIPTMTYDQAMLYRQQNPQRY